MKYSDFLHESEVKHNTISYDLLTPKPAKGLATTIGKPEVFCIDKARLSDAIFVAA